MREHPSRPTVSETYEIGSWRFDSGVRSLSDGLRTRRLTPKAAAVLEMLAEAEGHLVTRTDLLDRVWPDADICEEALTHSVAEIRRAMGDNGTRAILQTVHGAGYRLCAPIRVVGGNEPPRTLEQEFEFDLDAYLDYCEGRQLCEREAEVGLDKAVELCGSAAAKAPQCALFLSELAALTAMRRLYSKGDINELQDALTMAERAVNLRPDLACGHVSRGVVLTALGRKTDATSAFQQAILQDPQDFQAHYQFARALFAFRALPQAARMAEHAAVLRPDDYRPLFHAATAWSVQGDVARARSAAITGLARLRLQLASGNGGTRPESAQGLFLALIDRHDEAHRTITAHEKTRDAMLYYGVAAYAALGEVKTALDRLERVVERGFRHVDWLRADPTLEPLRDAPRFKRLMASLERA